MRRRSIILGGIGTVCATTGSRPGRATVQDNYTSRPIRVIAANPSGGPRDLITRAFSKRAAADLGQPFVALDEA